MKDVFKEEEFIQMIEEKKHIVVIPFVQEDKESYIVVKKNENIYGLYRYEKDVNRRTGRSYIKKFSINIKNIILSSIVREENVFSFSYKSNGKMNYSDPRVRSFSELPKR